MDLQSLLPRWQTTDQLPITFLCGGKPIRGIPSAWNPQISVRNIDRSITETTVLGISPQGLEVRLECRQCHDFAAVEYAAFISNRSTADSPLVENIRMGVSIPGSDAVLYHGNGDTLTEHGYEWWYSSLAQRTQTLSPIGDGTSCNGAFPYMRLLFENYGLNIAIGGRRNDIETMRRSVTLHYTDVGYGNHPVKLKQHRQMFEWIPYFRAHNMNWCNEQGTYDRQERLPDRYSYYVAMAPAMTDMTRFDAGEEAFALAKEMQAIWRKAAPYMLRSDYYPLTECREFPEDFYAAQFHDPGKGEGIVHMINGAAATRTQFSVALKGLQPGTRYTLRSAEQKREWTCTGAELMAGIAVTLAPKTADIWFYEKI